MDEKMEKMTRQQAYCAMYHYLENLYQLTHSDDLGAFLGEMSILPDGNTADPAIWQDWLQAVEKVKENDNCFKALALKWEKPV